MACKYLEGKGLKIIARNYYTRFEELDIVAWDENEKNLVFVEVKFRRNGDFGLPEEAVTPAKQKKICNGARVYMMMNNINPEVVQIRFDVIGIMAKKGTREHEIVHLQNAFSYVGK